MVVFTGVTLKLPALQMVEVIAVITGVGLTVIVAAFDSLVATYGFGATLLVLLSTAFLKM